MNTETKRKAAYDRAYQAAMAGGCNNTECDELGREAADCVTETKHTLTPQETAINGVWITQPDDEGRGAMIVDSATESYIMARHLRYETAQRIVRACNEHAALCAVAEAAEKVLKQCQAAQSEQAGHRASLFAVDKITNALANLAAVRKS